MNKVDRIERIGTLVKIALDILKRNDRGCYLHLQAGRARARDLRDRGLALSHRHFVDDPDGRAILAIKNDGQVVLRAEWTHDGFNRTSFKPGDWEDALLRWDRAPGQQFASVRPGR